MSETFDLVVIGAGPGGHAAAEHAARWGVRVAIIEKNLWGGTCTHRGCIPTKALLACSRQYADLKRGKRMGINVGKTSFDFSAIKRHQQHAVNISALGVERSLKDAGVELKVGEGRILSPHEVQWISAEGEINRLQAENIIIAWGSEPLLLPGVETSKRILTSDGFLALEKLPETVIIVGGSAIGVEFATFLAELDVRVGVIELMDQLLPLEDQEAASFLKQNLTGLGIDIHTSTKVETLHEVPDGILVTATQQSRTLELTAEYALVCTGRKPSLRTDELNQLGIQYDHRGIFVDGCQMTNVEGIYAIGDVTGGIMLAHRAIQQGRAVASHLYGDRSVTYREDAVPFVVYTHPNVARVGLTEKQVKADGIEPEVRRSHYGANIMARVELRGNGFVKALFHKDMLVGVTIVGEQACELIAPMSLAVANSMKKKELRKWTLPHPTLSEVLSLF
ncbi:MAG: dihydrolipoyl dehydrogenase [Syntrophales bacterium]|nr:dihydrolipoyl dehydrogenase [Syntrophales bacterium]